LLRGAGSHRSPLAKWLQQRLLGMAQQRKQHSRTGYPEPPKKASADNAKGKASNQLQ